MCTGLLLNRCVVMLPPKWFLDFSINYGQPFWFSVIKVLISKVVISPLYLSFIDCIHYIPQVNKLIILSR